MKLTNIIKLLVIIFIISSCVEKQKPLEAGMYRINGTVTGLENGEIYTFNSNREVDTIKIVNGTFQIENKLESIVGQVSLVKDPNLRGMTEENYLSLFVEPTIMSLDFNYENFSKSTLTGSVTQDDQYRLDKIKKDIAANYTEELNYFESIRKKYNDAAKAGASEEALEKIKYEDNEARGKLTPMWEGQSKATLQFVKDNPKSFVSVRSLISLTGSLKYDEVKAIVDQLNPEHLKTRMGTRLITELENMQKGVPGAKAGNFDTVDINGNPLKLADFKGKYLLIDFWASWCVPCRKGNPHLIQLYKKYNSKGLEILGVSDDDRAHDKWRKAVEKDQIGIWHHVLRGLKIKNGRIDFNDKSTDISEGYNISTLPTKILVDPNGVIIGRYGSGGGNDADMDRDLAKLFN